MARRRGPGAGAIVGAGERWQTGALMRDPRSPMGAGGTPAGGRSPGVAGGPVVIFRPRGTLRLAGPLLVLAGAGLVATGALAGAALVVVGLIVSLSWLPRIEIGNDVVRARGLAGTTVIRFDEVR